MNKIVRKKTYKTMSVLELVSVRKELVEKIQQIDAILHTAATALNDVTSFGPKTNNFNRNNRDAAFETQNNKTETNQRFFANQVPMNTQAPIMPPSIATNPDQSSGFSIFDAESFIQQQEQQQQERDSNISESVEFDFNSEEVNKEIETLKQGIQNITDLNNHVQDS